MTRNTDNPREALLKRLRAANGADPEIDMMIADFFGDEKLKTIKAYQGSFTFSSAAFYPQDFVDVAKPYTGSIDAAVALKNRVRPGWACAIDEMPDGTGEVTLFKPEKYGPSAKAANPAIALVCALVMSMDDG